MIDLRTAACAALLTTLAPTLGSPLGAQAPDTYLDPVARSLHEVARENWQAIDESIVRYTALIQQRIAAAIRTPLKDRTLYRNETAVRAFWDREYEPLLQILGTRAQYPGREIAERDGNLTWLDDLAFDAPFEPGGDRLLFGITDQGEEGYEPRDDDFWFAHPLAAGADSLYRYRSGDTLTLALPDGRTLQTVKLDVLPREADVHRITGALWIEPESGALVQAVYRLSQQFDAMRDVPELQEEEERGSFKYVPGLLKPWTFDMNLVAIEYGLWDFEIWLPRTMRVEGEAAAGIMKFPVSMDISYRIESVTTEEEEAQALAAAAAAAQAGDPGSLTERHFESRAEAMAFIAELLSDGSGVSYEPLAGSNRVAAGRESRFIVPEDRSLITTSPDLPPPIWDDAPGFASDEDLEEWVTTLADLPAPPIRGIPWAANWGWHRPDLIRYNRVEGPAVGGRFQARLGMGPLGPWNFSASGFMGLADLEPKARLTLEKSTVMRRVAVGAYRELQATDPRGRYLEFGNTLNAFLFGRDDGEYFLATGLDLTWRPPEAGRDSHFFRAYVERQDPVSKKIDFALFRSWSGDGIFRPNIPGDRVEEVGAELRLSPWWGTDPLLPQVGLDLYGHGALWREAGTTDQSDYARGSATLRVAVPLAGGRWRLGTEIGGGTTWGVSPLQRHWFLGGPSSLRGYGASTVFGSSFTRARTEVARRFDVATVSVFGDAGWAGRREAFDTEDILYGVGIGGSVLDGLIRLDLSHGLTGSSRQLRLDLYLDAIL
jgi:hypothetical protein